MDPYAEQRAVARQITDPERIEALATKALLAIHEQYPDFEQVSFYFKRALIETWPVFCDENGFEKVMERAQQIMTEHHAHLFYMIYGDHGYADEVQELIRVLAENIYNKINDNPNHKPSWNPKWLECAQDLGVDPDELKNHQYITWIGHKVDRARREKQGKIMGIDPDKVGPYDYELFLMGKNRRRK